MLDCNIGGGQVDCSATLVSGERQKHFQSTETQVRQSEKQIKLKLTLGIMSQHCWGWGGGRGWEKEGKRRWGGMWVSTIDYSEYY